MGLLDGQDSALIFGVANDHSIAWGIARALHDAGATSASARSRASSRSGSGRWPSRSGRRSWSPATSSPTSRSGPCSQKWGAAHGQLDILVHALAFARREDLEGGFVDTSRDGFALALDVSAYSLVALTREAQPYLHRGSSVITLSYYGAEKVVAHYNVMGVAKAALEASVRYLAADLGPDGVRVNAISAGPVRTAGRRGDRRVQEDVRRVRRRRPAAARTSPPRTSGGPPSTWPRDLSSAVTGEVIYVDGGFNILGVPSAD